jgi:hypothetical protein
MRSTTLIAALALAIAAVAAPVPNDPISDSITKITDLVGPPFGNGKGNGNDGNVSYNSKHQKVKVLKPNPSNNIFLPGCW